MVKIGLVYWNGGGWGEDHIKPAKQPWLKDVKIIQKGPHKGLIPFENALQAALKHKYKDVEVSLIKWFNESQLEKNDVNFLVSANLLTAWEKNDAEYKRVEKLMKKPSLNFYPNLKEQFFLFDKGDYLEYFKKKGVPIAPTFVVRGPGNAHKILQKVKREGWKSFVLKPHRGQSSFGIGKFDVDDKNTEKAVSKFLNKSKKYPAFVCQEVMNGFAKFWEIKSFWINGEFKYYVAMKAADKVFSESKIYGSNPEEFGKVSPTVLKEIKKIGKKVVDTFPRINEHSQPPLYLRIDFGCCRDNTMDGKSYFLNEIEYGGCAIFTMEGIGKNIFDTWVKAYYEKAKEFEGNKTKVSKKTKRLKRVKRAKTRRQNRYKTHSYRGGAHADGVTQVPDKTIQDLNKTIQDLNISNTLLDLEINRLEHEYSKTPWVNNKLIPVLQENKEFNNKLKGMLDDKINGKSIDDEKYKLLEIESETLEEKSQIVESIVNKLDGLKKSKNTDKLKQKELFESIRQMLKDLDQVDMIGGGTKKIKRTKKKKTRK